MPATEAPTTPDRKEVNRETMLVGKTSGWARSEIKSRQLDEATMRVSIAESWTERLAHGDCEVVFQVVAVFPRIRNFSWALTQLSLLIYFCALEKIPRGAEEVRRSHPAEARHLRRPF